MQVGIFKNNKLETENNKLGTENEKLSAEVECLKKDCHIYLEALILSRHKIFGKSSERTADDGQQSFFNEAEAEYAEKTEEPVKKTVKGYTRRNPKTRRDEIITQTSHKQSHHKPHKIAQKSERIKKL